MSQNFSDVPASQPPTKQRYRWGLGFGLLLWVLFGFIASQFLMGIILYLLSIAGASFADVNESVFRMVTSACIYLLMLAIVVGVPIILWKKKLLLEDLGLDRLLTWKDLGLAPIAFILYFIGSALLIYVVSQVFSGFDMNQQQPVGFENISQRYEYLLAFFTLVVVAPVAEEVLFRGYLYGKLRGIMPLWIAAVFTSLLFAAIHLQWNVAVDVFVLSIIMCLLREVTGSIWAGIVVHIIKNGIAFYLLFINPSLLTTIGG
jgi:membrane protease YdiL (CAAX protease family)